MVVVVAGVAAEDTFEMCFIENQEMVEALRSHGADEPFGKSVRIRCPIGRLQDLGALGSEDIIEARHVLGVTISDQEVGGEVSVGEVTGDVPRLFGDPSCVGMGGHPGDPDPPAGELDEEEYVGSCFNSTVSTVKKSVARTPDAWARRN
jgi:hypothetical protein